MDGISANERHNVSCLKSFLHKNGTNHNYKLPNTYISIKQWNMTKGFLNKDTTPQNSGELHQFPVLHYLYAK